MITKKKLSDNRWEVIHDREYSSKAMLDIDKNEFDADPKRFEGRNPSMKPYQLKVHKLETEFIEGAPPATRHKLRIKAVIDGPEKALDQWIAEVDALFVTHHRERDSDLLRKYHEEHDGDSCLYVK